MANALNRMRRRISKGLSKKGKATVKRTRGDLAEKIAADHLERRGYTVIERNFECKLGEIDIIARHKGDLVFVEVRSRRTAATLNPIHSVNRRKQQKISRTAQVYLSGHCSNPTPARFDVVLVTMEPTPEVEIIPYAFSVDSPAGATYG